MRNALRHYSSGAPYMWLASLADRLKIRTNVWACWGNWLPFGSSECYRCDQHIRPNRLALRLVLSRHQGCKGGHRMSLKEGCWYQRRAWKNWAAADGWDKARLSATYDLYELLSMQNLIIISFYSLSFLLLSSSILILGRVL